MSWDSVLSFLLWYCGGCTIVTVIFLSLMNNPKYFIFVYNRLQYLKLGLKKKKIQLSSKFSFSYLERKSKRSDLTVLLVHGFSSSKDMYLGVVKYLPQRVNIIAVDLFGHGETSLNEEEVYSFDTYVKYLKKFVDLIGLSSKKFHLVGGSLGGGIAGMYAVHHPDDLISVTMMCPAGISYKSLETTIKEAKRSNKHVLMPKTTDEFRELVCKTSHKQYEMPSWIISGLLQLRLEKEKFFEEALYALVEPHSICYLEENISKIQVPAFAIWGKEDEIIPIECLDMIEEKVTCSLKVERLENVGHAIVLERPRKVAFLLIEFFNTFK